MFVAAEMSVAVCQAATNCLLSMHPDQLVVRCTTTVCRFCNWKSHHLLGRIGEEGDVLRLLCVQCGSEKGVEDACK